MKNLKLIAMKDVQSATGLSRTAVYEKVRVGDFPPSIRVSDRSVRWIYHEVQEWITEQILESRGSTTGVEI